MTIKVLADKVLAFDRGDRDNEGQLVTEKTSIGFCTLPDWVEKTDYYKLAVADGSLKAFTAPGESEAVLKEQEKLASLKAEIAAMEEKRDLMAKAEVPSDSENGTPDPDAKAGPDAKPDKNTTK